MSRHFLPYAPDQLELAPRSLAELLPEEHLVFFVSEVVDQLDLKEIVRGYKPTGGPAYEPGMMLKLLLYAYATGEYSSRQIQRRIREEIAYRYLAGGYSPTYKAISEFRRKNLRAFQGLFLQLLQMAADVGMVKLGHVAIDGTKIRANASRHKAMSYGHMKVRLQELEDEVKAMTDRAEETDRREEGHPAKIVTTLPKGLRRREARLQRIREAKKRIETEARERGEGPSHPGGGETPPDKAQTNFTDPDSHIMKCADGSFQQAYNVQVAVDTESLLIVASHVTNHPTDVLHLPVVLETVKRNMGAVPRMVSADAGYYSQRNIAAVQEVGAEPFIPPEKMRHHAPLSPSPRGRIPKGLTEKERMRRKLRTSRGRRIYLKRMASVEPVFAHIKERRSFRRFSLRGLGKVAGEWDLVALAHNLRKVYLHLDALLIT